MATTTILPFTRLSTELSTFKESISNSYENKQDDAVLQELLQECQLKIISLKMLTRNVLSIIQEQRMNVTKEKEVADTAHLQLQNLLYEKNLLLNEIKSCDNFKTPEYDKIELVSKTLFNKNAPKNLTKVNEKNNPHEFLMNQLEYELMVRKKLTQKRDEYIKKLKEESDQLHAKIKQNEDLRSLFKDIIKPTLNYKDGTMR